MAGGARGWAAARMKRGGGVAAEGGKTPAHESTVGKKFSVVAGSAKWPA
jgi:hypothetical protein